ncbi:MULTISPECIES: isoprenyl transferase [Enterococcus]|uniref:Isoprenyl transferase n=1 Tax=Enterococcus mundtii TaxID=53346 RepID=A0A2M9FTJ7_ENTMU|nr:MULTISPECIES: isoprenyl transferase [Enterococcus]EOH62267.1 undecaprenyl pyrophosphate synthase [Enterococcus mundtii ATCC 882]EOU12925.1 undecaprenyl pyrophosphate synthase [Enterococcus mundtii ATCC 882]MBE9911160.1 isoprenyl transferase [Enterococcus mundtii]MBO1085784.1 isoprenyl transferase [Enterococcus mundtii]MDB7100887.1 isoprenyl transferase [Enterococcus mundtii]
MLRFFPQKNKYIQEKSEHHFDAQRDIPKHIAIIMDGNGRWAQNRRLPRVAGHKEGMETVKKVTKKASRLGVKVLTLYAFSTENWKRPKEEVNFLMQLPVDFFDTFVPELIAENVKVQVMGYEELLPEHTQDAVRRAIEQTKENTGMILNFALNYGSRAEIISAVKAISEQVKENDLSTEDIDEDMIADHLMTGFLPPELRDPGLVIRTSGEERISNFLLWQIAYSELYFSKALWPDFDGAHLEEAIASYQHRDRRFGGVKSVDKGEQS